MDLDRGSEVLKDIGATLRQADYIRIATCIEQKRKDGDVHVDFDQAMSYSRSEEIVEINEYHKDMNKFDLRSDSGYQTVLGFLDDVLSQPLSKTH